MKKIFIIIPIFYISCHGIFYFFGCLWSKSQFLQYFLAFPILLLLFNLMRFVELIIMYFIASKIGSIVSFKSKKIYFCFKNIQINMIFLRVNLNESSFVIRKISINNSINSNLNVKFYKSVLTEKQYVADFYIFLILFLKVAFLFFFIKLFLILFPS
jgi:hypothetical protein